MSDELLRACQEAVRAVKREKDVGVDRYQRELEEKERERVKLEEFLFDSWKDSWGLGSSDTDWADGPISIIKRQLGNIQEGLDRVMMHIIVRHAAVLMSHVVRDTFLYQTEIDGEMAIGIHWGGGALGKDEEIPLHEEKVKDILR